MLRLASPLLVGFALALFVFAGAANAAEFFVAKAGSDSNEGSLENPFLTIGKAASVAQAGDTITVGRGVYREWVNPPRGGMSEDSRIVYRAAPGEDVRIMGSEPVSDWDAQGTLWRKSLPNEFFASFNPFTSPIRNPGTIPPVADDAAAEWGWLMYGRWTHRGDVYLNDLGLTEVETPQGLETGLTWYAEQQEGSVVLWANFGNADPNANRVEVNVREHGFYPSQAGLGYITISGFKVMNIASHWAPPILPQPGAIGVNGGHHWLIENNLVRHGKTVCISIGNPSGAASLATSGHHVIRNNILRRCGQAGVAGELWNHHSIIRDNVIEDINYRDEFGGYETAGIKLHRTVGSVIEGNFIRNVRSREGFSGHGIWIDYQNLHTRVSGNVLSEISDIALYFEANWEGPHLVDNNIVLGGVIKSASSRQEAWFHNLFVGDKVLWQDQDFGGRPPVNHQRWFNNVFVGNGLEEMPQRSDIQSANNLYLAGAGVSPAEPAAVTLAADPGFTLVREENAMLLEFNWPAGAVQPVPALTEKEIDLPLRQADGTMPDFQTDFFGEPRGEEPLVGPFAGIKAGNNRLLLLQLPEGYDVLR